MRTILPILLVLAQTAFSQTGEAQIQPLYEQGERALAQGRYSEAEEAYDKLCKLSPATAEFHGRLGLTYFQERKFAAAIPELRQAMKLKPSLPNTDILLAMALSELDRFSEALPGLEKGFHKTSDVALKRMAGLQLQRTYTGLQRDSQAVEVALELVRLYPKDPEVLYHSGRLFGNFAYLTMTKLAEVAPESVWRHQASGEAHESQGDYDVAIMEYRAVLERDPSRPGIHLRIGRSLLSRAAADATEEAAKEFEQELQLDPSNGNASYELGEIRRKKGLFDQAAALFESALKYDPAFADAEIGLGRSLTSAGKADQAILHFRKAIGLDPAGEVAYFHLARAYGQLSKSDEQQKALAEFQRLRQAKTVTPAARQDLTKQSAEE